MVPLSTMASQRPTLAEVARLMREGHVSLMSTTTADVLRAARKRGVPVVENRVEKRRIPDIYFGLVGR